MLLNLINAVVSNYCTSFHYMKLSFPEISKVVTSTNIFSVEPDSFPPNKF